ncbi:MAG TPA: methionyl-tRNA formyltransferase [Patescibacteria group bacterium]|nr:methionyl-tRNA formyltransferase [Patescibacteria group bacterium]
MKKISETVVFFGSGPVAAKALELLSADFNIEVVITKPQPLHHKNKFEVIAVSVKNNLKIEYASNKLELSELIKKRKFKSRLGVVIDYGIIISKDVIDYFQLGIINSHFSLLPKWRGADPISFAILNGDKLTGVSIILINEAMDEGQLLTQKSINLDKNIDSIQLTTKLIKLSQSLLISTIPNYINGKISPYNQKGRPSYSRKLTKEDGQIDFLKPADKLEREIRAYIEWPRSKIKINNTNIIVTKAHLKSGQGKAGNIFQLNKELGIYTTKNILIFDKLIPQGKNEMSVEAFLAGYKTS